jgi:hypothetical protein
MYVAVNSTMRAGYQYFITFIDDLSRYNYIYWIRNKVESFEKFKNLQNKM